MPITRVDQAKPAEPAQHGSVKPMGAAEQNSTNDVPPRQLQAFGRPDPGEKPLGLLRLVVILMSSHIGVRSRTNREEDFRRANGLHVFIAAIVYFLLLVGVLILLVNLIIR